MLSLLFYQAQKFTNFCSFIFDELTSKVANILAVFLRSQESYENTVRIVSTYFDFILIRINEKSREKL